MSLTEIEEMFANMRANTDWNVDGPLLWGYFFTDADKSRLVEIADDLQGRGYEIVEIFEADDGGHVLHVERVERHTPESLHARNLEFRKLAKAAGIEGYDGMDVGLPDTDLN